MTGHHYRQNLRELARLVDEIDSLTMIEGILPQQLKWGRERYLVRIYEKKLEYKERHPSHLEFDNRPKAEQFDMHQGDETAR